MATFFAYFSRFYFANSNERMLVLWKIFGEFIRLLVKTYSAGFFNYTFKASLYKFFFLYLINLEIREIDFYYLKNFYRLLFKLLLKLIRVEIKLVSSHSILIHRKIRKQHFTLKLCNQWCKWAFDTLVYKYIVEDEDLSFIKFNFKIMFQLNGCKNIVSVLNNNPMLKILNI